MNQTVERIRQGVRDRIADGTFYRFWWYGMDQNDVGCMAPPWRRSYLGYNCTSLYNDILGEMQSEGYSTQPVGGTGIWNSVVGTNSTKAYEKVNSAKNYPPGTFGVTPYVNDSVQGHLQMVYTAAESAGAQSWGDQYMAQSDVTKGVSDDGNSGWPGPNIDYTMGWSFQYIDTPTWIGLIPGVPIIDGFPGYSASALEIVDWYVKVCKWWYDMPPIIPLACIGTELSTVLDKSRDYSIWDITGYASAVDYDSYGQHQQRAEYYPFPWDFETSAWSFLARVDQVLGSDAYPNPDDPIAIGNLIQEAQQSAYPDRYAETYEWVRPLLDEVIGGEPTPPPVEPEPKPPKKIEMWMGFTDEDAQWMRGVGVPRGSWIRPTETDGKIWLELVPAVYTSSGRQSEPAESVEPESIPVEQEPPFSEPDSTRPEPAPEPEPEPAKDNASETIEIAGESEDTVVIGDIMVIKKEK